MMGCASKSFGAPNLTYLLSQKCLVPSEFHTVPGVALWDASVGPGCLWSGPQAIGAHLVLCIFWRRRRQPLFSQTSQLLYRRQECKPCESTVCRLEKNACICAKTKSNSQTTFLLLGTDHTSHKPPLRDKPQRQAWMHGCGSAFGGGSLSARIHPQALGASKALLYCTALEVQLEHPSVAPSVYDNQANGTEYLGEYKMHFLVCQSGWLYNEWQDIRLHLPISLLHAFSHRNAYLKSTISIAYYFVENDDSPLFPFSLSLRTCFRRRRRKCSLETKS